MAPWLRTLAKDEAADGRLRLAALSAQASRLMTI
jgi:hypothetical protein